MSATPRISVRDLGLSRGDRVLIDALNFDVAAGSIHAIIGGNGSGKSTLIAALAGDLIPLRGEVRLDGDSIQTLSVAEQANRRSVLMQQGPALPFTPRDVIALAAPTLTPIDIDAVLAEFTLTEFADRPLLTLSGGERGRAMLAMTMARHTPIMLLDEPTAAFDRHYRKQFAKWLAQWREQGMAIVVVTHDLEIEQIADAITSLD